MVSVSSFYGCPRIPLLTSISVQYAAAIVFEVRQSPTLGTVLRFKFKNGTDDTALHTFNLKFPGWDQPGDVPLTTFLAAFEPAAINTTTQWCNACGQTALRGCADLKGVPGPAPASFLEARAEASSPPAIESTCNTHHDAISPLGAGFMGAGLTLAVVTVALAALMLLGFFSVGGKKSKRAKAESDTLTADLRSGVRVHSTRIQRITDSPSQKFVLYEKGSL